MQRIAVSLIAVVFVACSGPKSAPSGTPVPVSPPAATATSVTSASALASPAPSGGSEPSGPVGLVAIGHSGLTGEGTAGEGEPMSDNSWATGTNPAVDSVYLRMVAAHPETEGHVANAARGGAVAAELPTMATVALRTVPRPALVIISTIDNDIRCDGTDPDHVAEFGASVQEALTAISAASPDSKILLVGQLGRPSVEFIETLIAEDPSVKQFLTGPGICDFMNVDGELVPAHFQTLTEIIEAYETEEARVCMAFPHCRTDGGARAAYEDKRENFGAGGHLNVQGQAEEAELIWPVVVEALGW
jgi:hypothetical protein